MADILEIDTKGICLFCLKDCLSADNTIGQDGSGEGSREVTKTNKSESMKMLIEFFKIDPTKLILTSCVPARDEKDNGIILLTLCDSCVAWSDQFGEVAKQVLDLQRKIKDQVGDLYATMKMGEVEGDQMKVYLERMKTNQTEGLVRPVAVQKLRSEIMNKSFGLLLSNAFENLDMSSCIGIDDDVICLDATGARDDNIVPNPLARGNAKMKILKLDDLSTGKSTTLPGAKQEFHKKSAITQDTKSDDSDMAFYKCNACLQMFGSSIALQMHSKFCAERKKDEISYQCPSCQTAFRCWTTQKMHTEKCCGKEELFFECNECKKVFGSAAALQMHSRNCIKPKIKNDDFQCCHCFKVFPSWTALQIHSTNEFCANAVSDEKELRNYKCYTCKMTFRHLIELRNHKHNEHFSSEQLKQKIQNQSYRRPRMHYNRTDTWIWPTNT